MVFAVISLLTGILSLLKVVPIYLPAFALLIALYALFQEKKAQKKNKNIFILTTVAIILNGILALTYIVRLISG